MKLSLVGILAFALIACHKTEAIRPEPHDIGSPAPEETGPQVDPLVIKSGLGSGTFTVSSGYITGWCATAQTDGGMATVIVTPTGPTILDAGPQQPIYIASGEHFCLPRPVIQGASFEMGKGTTLVFTNTEKYAIVLSQGGT